MEGKNTHKLIDTHAHLASSRFEGELDDILKRAFENDIGRIISIACDTEDSISILKMASEREMVSPTVGIHPLYVHEEDSKTAIETIRELSKNPSVAAIGEIGLDYFHDTPVGFTDESWKKLQHEVFEALLQVSIDRDLPTVIHQRSSAEDTLAVLKNFPEAKAVLHCFGGTVEEASAFLELGHFISFTGILTFPNAESVRETAKTVPLDRVMVETDGPYLAPVPFRGKRCEPYMVKHTAEKLGEVHGLSLEEITEITTRNACGFFKGLD